LACIKRRRHVGAVGGKLPGAVVAVSGKRFRIGVALDRDFVRQLSKLLRELYKDILAAFGRSCNAALEECPHFGFQQFDTQPFRRNGHFNVVFELVEVCGWPAAVRPLTYPVVSGQGEAVPGPGFAAADRFGSALGVAEVAATASWISLLVFMSQSTMKRAIMAVTKSAYATFRLPPGWPPCTTFFLTILT
jgi:hypothetical protein